MRRTKIICTLGPAVDSEEAIKKLIRVGMNAARFNFSHGTHESHASMLLKLKRVRDTMGRPVATIMDTKGPEIRIRGFEHGRITLTAGDKFSLYTADVPGNQTGVSVTYANLENELSPGCHVLIDDGLIDLVVEEIVPGEIRCVVDDGGELSANKSINLPGVNIQLPALTERDKEDLKFAVEHDFDFVAASFVRKASDVLDIRAELDAHGGKNISIIAKIENREGVNNLEEIIEVADALMVARGDLGVEIPAYEVPVLQKKMISKCVMQGKVVVTATQMLDSMIRNPRPTRAEVSDVANAVYDGTSVVMLSGETASGKYPFDALQTMVDTVLAAEGAINYWGRFQKVAFQGSKSVNDAITHSCCQTAMDLKADYILAASKSGNTARLISRFRPACPIIAITTAEKARRQLAISWGVTPFLVGDVDSTDRLFAMCVDVPRKEGIVKTGDMVVIVAGIPIGYSGSTNLIKAQVVEEEE